MTAVLLEDETEVHLRRELCDYQGRIGLMNDKPRNTKDCWKYPNCDAGENS